MIPSEYYFTFYIFMVTIATLLVMVQCNSYGNDRLYTKNDSISFVYFISIILALYIGFRDPSAPEFGDSQAYTYWYNRRLDDPYIWNWKVENLLFNNIMNVFRSKSIPIYFFFFFIASIYFIGIAHASQLLFGKDAIAMFIVYLAGFSTFSFSTNGIKAGAAAALFLVALGYRKHGKKIFSIIFIILSIGFHHSMKVPALAFLVCSLYKKNKYYNLFWLFSFFVALFHITFFQNLFGGMGDEKAAAYLINEGEYIHKDLIGGFRIDFIIYSFMPMLVGLIVSKTDKDLLSDNYKFLLNLYTFINAIWLLCMYASFTNRIAYLSWFMYPFVLAYPFLDVEWCPNQYRKFSLVAVLHLLFLLFMTFIYY